MTRPTRNAWIALAATVVTFPLGIVVGEVLFSLFGYDAGETAPLLPTLASAIPAILVIVSAPFTAWRIARAAYRAGDASARLPMAVSVGVGAYFLLTNVIGLLSR